MLKCWKEGNTEELARIVKADVEAEGEFKEFNERCGSSRDNNMVQKVREYLADPENKTYFVVVGADIWWEAPELSHNWKMNTRWNKSNESDMM